LKPTPFACALSLAVVLAAHAAAPVHPASEAERTRPHRCGVKPAIAGFTKNAFGHGGGEARKASEDAVNRTLFPINP
jgi:hypothetical protein